MTLETTQNIMIWWAHAL